MIRRPPRSTLFPTRRSSDLWKGNEADSTVVACLRAGASGHEPALGERRDRKSTRLNSSHSQISYAVFCLKKKKTNATARPHERARPTMPCPAFSDDPDGVID